MATRHRLLRMLCGGDLRSIGRSNAAVREVLKNVGLAWVLLEGMRSADPVVRMRAADALEKVSAAKPHALTPFKAELLRLARGAEQQELQWHLAQMLPRLPLTHAERTQVIEALLAYLSSSSSIVKTCVMQALAEFAQADDELRPQVTKRLRALVASGTPAMRARGRKLIAELSAGSAKHSPYSRRRRSATV